jgi:hypothetical protein
MRSREHPKDCEGEEAADQEQRIEDDNDDNTGLREEDNGDIDVERGVMESDEELVMGEDVDDM